MHPFEYVAAHNIDEAVGLLNEKDVRARSLVGGTDILVQLRGDRREIDRIVDIKPIPEMNELSFNPEEGVVLGAAVSCQRVYEHPEIARYYPALVDSAAMIGSIQIQNRASVGGNLCNAAPSADCIPSLIVLNAQCTIAGPSGIRIIPVSDFCVGPGRSVLADGELLVQVRIPRPSPESGSHYLRFIPRNEMDIAVAGAGASVTLNGDGKTIVAARVALASVAPTPLYVKEAETALVGRAADDATLREAADEAMAASRPISDMRGTADQRRHLVRVLTRRALEGAIRRAHTGSGI